MPKFIAFWTRIDPLWRQKPRSLNYHLLLYEAIKYFYFSLQSNLVTHRLRLSNCLKCFEQKIT